jgi:hypothetical protein
MAFDGRSIYLLADGVDVLAIDPHTYEITDVIEPLTIVTGLNALAVSPDALWVIASGTSILQRSTSPSGVSPFIDKVRDVGATGSTRSNAGSPTARR